MKLLAHVSDHVDISEWLPHSIPSIKSEAHASANLPTRQGGARNGDVARPANNGQPPLMRDVNEEKIMSRPHDDEPFISGVEASRRISELRRPTSMQEPKVWTVEDLKAVGLPEHFIDIAHWWGSLEELKEDFNL